MKVWTTIKPGNLVSFHNLDMQPVWAELDSQWDGGNIVRFFREGDIALVLDVVVRHVPQIDTVHARLLILGRTGWMRLYRYEQERTMVIG